MSDENNAPPVIPNIPASPDTGLVREQSASEKIGRYVSLVMLGTGALTAAGLGASLVGKVSAIWLIGGLSLIIGCHVASTALPSAWKAWHQFVVVPTPPMTEAQAVSKSKLGKPPKP